MTRIPLDTVYRTVYREGMGRRAVRGIGWVAYGLAPRWLAAIFVAFDAIREMNESNERQAGR